METNRHYKIEIILNNKELFLGFEVICYSEIFNGNKKDAENRAETLLKEWKGDLYRIIKL
ncbi:MAG: hypothetical protein SPL00_04360 [Bacilli bacterium]|nr:hypothetical protein [Bacilli bacterium]